MQPAICVRLSIEPRAPETAITTALFPSPRCRPAISPVRSRALAEDLHNLHLEGLLGCPARHGFELPVFKNPDPTLDVQDCVLNHFIYLPDLVLLEVFVVDPKEKPSSMIPESRGVSYGL